MSKLTILTLGHSNRSIGEFINKLKNNNVVVLIDARTKPYSRYCPHFNKNALCRALTAENIQYLWRGKNLGGKGVNEGYEEAIDELVKMARDEIQICVMCSEGDYTKCHRYLILTPSLQERGLSVIHIEYENDTRKQTHKHK